MERHTTMVYLKSHNGEIFLALSDCSGIPPGTSFTYFINIGQQIGTYWIHSHIIGQYPNGLRAPFVIQDPEPPYEYDREEVVSVSDWVEISISI
jgi:iron transport multicopper oxidase